MWLVIVLLPCVRAMLSLDSFVDSKIGTIKGVISENGGYTMFLGIPYGKVDKDNPFGVAKPYDKFESIFNANNDSVICPQVLKNKSNLIMTPDCLNLNVYVPNKASYSEKLAVLVRIHGGAFEEGYPGMEGPKYLLQHDIIVVTFSYRLGVYGFMCLNIPEVPGNQGLKDQLLALKWVHKNIEDFGGDANRITVYGQSAGSAAVEIHLVTQKKRLFNQAILSSGSLFRREAIMKADATLPLKIAEQLSYNTNNVYKALSFLQKADFELVVTAAHNLSTIYHGCIEKEFHGVENLITEYEEKIDEVEDMSILLGITDDEYVFHRSGGCFDCSDPFQEFVDHFEGNIDGLYGILRSFYVRDENNDSSGADDFFSDMYFNYPSLLSVRRLLRSAAKVFYYMFSYTDDGRNSKDGIFKGVHHSEDLKYIFDMNGNLTGDGELMRDIMTDMWANFVKNGIPTSSLVELSWPATTENLEYLDINSNLTIRSKPFHRRMAFWDLLYEYKKYAQKLSDV